MNVDQLKVLIVLVGTAGVIFWFFRQLLVNKKAQAIILQREEFRKTYQDKHWN